jgi:integrase
MKVIAADPSVGVRMPTEAKVKKKTKEVIAYTKEEQEKIWKQIIQHPENVGYAAVAFQIETGLRAGELLALKWSDVNITQCKMRIHATIVNPQYTNLAGYQDSAKSKSSNRTIPLTPKALTILKRLKESSTTEWVFEKYNERMSYQQLTYQTKKLCKEARVKYLGEHVFRHTFATNCYYKGCDVKRLSKLLGHSDVTITYNIYVHLFGDELEDMRLIVD